MSFIPCYDYPSPSVSDELRVTKILTACLTAIRSNTEIRAISTTISRTLAKEKLGVVGIWLVVEVLKDEIVPL